MRNKVLVETSARHVHVTEADLKILFGADAELVPMKNLSQPGQYASEQRVSVVGPRGEMKNIVILGPTRNATQVEISATDARVLGIRAVIRESGDIEGTPGCTLVGPAGAVTITQGVIVAKRHIHITPAEASDFGVKDKEVVSVRVLSDQRSITFDDVVIRVRDDFALAMHIDTDEANAGNIGPGTYGEIIQ